MDVKENHCKENRNSLSHDNRELLLEVWHWQMLEENDFQEIIFSESKGCNNQLVKGWNCKRKPPLVKSWVTSNVITSKGEILDQKSIKVFCWKLEVKVENNESEMRKLETTAKWNLGNFTLGKKCAADILAKATCTMEHRWKIKRSTKTQMG